MGSVVSGLFGGGGDMKKQQAAAEAERNRMMQEQQAVQSRARQQEEDRQLDISKKAAEQSELVRARRAGRALLAFQDDSKQGTLG